MGHYCWCCGRVRANERFSGRGHRDHICKTCQRLPSTEREFRKARNDIDRLIRHGSIKKKERQLSQNFLDHPNERVRQYAESILEIHCEKTFYDRKLRKEEDEAIDRWIAQHAAYEESIVNDTATDITTFSDHEIPF